MHEYITNLWKEFQAKVWNHVGGILITVTYVMSSSFVHFLPEKKSNDTLKRNVQSKT